MCLTVQLRSFFFFLQEWYICPIETHLDNEEEKDFQNQAGGIFNAWQKFI